MSAFRKACAPVYRDLWFGCEETPSASKVMMASIVACGASLEETDAILGANAEVRRLEISRGCHVTVIESGKFLWSVSDCWLVRGHGRGILVFDDEDVVLAAHA
jgi:hypothetical protein